jgi:hypothetical protein
MSKLHFLNDLTKLNKHLVSTGVADCRKRANINGLKIEASALATGSRFLLHAPDSVYTDK